MITFVDVILCSVLKLIYLNVFCLLSQFTLTVPLSTKVYKGHKGIATTITIHGYIKQQLKQWRKYSLKKKKKNQA